MESAAPGQRVQDQRRSAANDRTQQWTSIKEAFAGPWALGAHAAYGYERAGLIKQKPKQKPGVASHPGEIGAIHEFQFPE
jgi:hypothetical protein